MAHIPPQRSLEAQHRLFKIPSVQAEEGQPSPSPSRPRGPAAHLLAQSLCRVCPALSPQQVAKALTCMDRLTTIADPPFSSTPQVQGRYKVGNRKVHVRYKEGTGQVPAGTRKVHGRYKEGTWQVEGRYKAGIKQVQGSSKEGTKQVQAGQKCGMAGRTGNPVVFWSLYPVQQVASSTIRFCVWLRDAASALSGRLAFTQIMRILTTETKGSCSAQMQDVWHVSCQKP